MPVETLVVGPLETNCFVVWGEGGTDALVIDAGGDADRIAEAIESRGLVPRVLFMTHGHIDHIAANEELGARYPDMEHAILESERDLLMRPTLNLSLFLGGGVKPPEPERLLAEGDELAVGELRLGVLHLPGHTPGGAGLSGEIEGERVVFAGDTLFAGSVGRVDFPGGDAAVLVASIREKLLSLPDETRVLTGHGPETTVGAERRHNPFLAGLGA
ncbi:MAG: MBL fold metallo-hydrolase [Planctomycetota bacterium]|jgi:glyoxylase-like metal-dependent hydrolase (beta-lactamase superfamily II)